MKQKINILLTFLLLITGHCWAQSEPFLFGGSAQKKIIVNNRILAVVNGFPISVYDVMKKMDMIFYKQFPEYTSSTEARYQFYKVNWKNMLEELIDKQLIVADAEENKLEVTTGDVRQEMESLFGPNIIVNLDKIELTFDEAWEIVKGDIIIKRAMYARVNPKAQKKVTPQLIKETYLDYTQNNIKPEEWKYRVISIRDEDQTTGAEVANLAHQMLKDDGVAFEDVVEKIKNHPLATEKTSVNISEEFHHKVTEVSDNYKEIIKNLEENTFSFPIAQKSRTGNSMVFRIFYLAEKNEESIPGFHDVEKQIHDQLLDDAIAAETEIYLNRLREHFHIQESCYTDIESFQPFLLN